MRYPAFLTREVAVEFYAIRGFQAVQVGVIPCFCTSIKVHFWPSRLRLDIVLCSPSFDSFTESRRNGLGLEGCLFLSISL